MQVRNKADFKLLFIEYYGPLCNFLLKYTHDEDLIEDIVQDVFVKIWQKRKDLSADVNTKAYLFQAAKNKAFERFRSQKTYEKHLDYYKENNQLSADEDDLADRLVRLEKINQSLRHLAPKCREVFVMHKYKGLTYAEIAEVLGISTKTVEGHMLKAIKNLRELLAK